jgi:hypothetical protein
MTVSVLSPLFTTTTVPSALATIRPGSLPVGTVFEAATAPAGMTETVLSELFVT